MNSAVLKDLFFVRDSSGATFGQRWEKTGFPQLKNDLRCLFRAKMGIYIALSEVLRVIDADSIQCRDLLNPSRLPFAVFDRSSARMAGGCQARPIRTRREGEPPRGNACRRPQPLDPSAIAPIYGAVQMPQAGFRSCHFRTARLSNTRFSNPFQTPNMEAQTLTPEPLGK